MPVTATCDCGKQLRAKDEAAGKTGRCPACGKPVTFPALGTQAGDGDPLITPSEAVHKSPPARPNPSDEAKTGNPAREWFMWAGFAGLLLAVVVGMVFLFNKHQRDSANREVAQKVGAAREAAGQQQYDEAIALLRQAAEIKNATALDDANRLIPEMEKAKGKLEAERLLASAEEAIQRKDTGEAGRLLGEYMANSHANEKAKASRLAADIELATSDAGAVGLLTRVPDEEFSAFQESGKLAALNSMDKGAIRDIYERTLRSAVPKAVPLREQIRLRKQKELMAAAERQKAEEEAEVRRQDVGREIRRFVARSESINCLAYSNNGHYVAAASNARMVNAAPHIPNPDYGDTAVWVWDANTGQLLHRFAPRSMDRIFYRFTGISFSPDSRFVAASRGDGVIRIWNAKTGKEVDSLREPQSGLDRLGDYSTSEQVDCLAFSPDGKHLITGGISHDERISREMSYPLRYWNLEKGIQLRVLQGHSAKVTSVAFTQDGRNAISGGFDRLLILWDVETGREIRTYDEHEKAVHCVGLSPDGRHALSGDTEGTLILWDVEAGKSLSKFSFTNAPVSVCFSPDGKRALVGLAGSTLRGDNPVLLDIERRKEVKLPDAFSGTPLDSLQAAFSPDGRRALYNQEGTERIRGNITKVAYLVLRGLP